MRQSLARISARSTSEISSLRCPQNTAPVRSISLWRALVSSFKAETRKAVMNQPGLEQALIQRKILDDLEKGKWFGKYWGPIVFKQKKSREYVNSLITFEKVAAQASKPEFRGTSLPATFPVWARLCFVHLWLVDFRLRYTPDPWRRQKFMRNTIDYLWEDLEQGIVETLGTRNPLVLTKYSKAFVNQWFGACLAYDYGTITSDAALADALWRNVYESDPNVPISELQGFVEYIRREQKAMYDLSDDVILNADFSFGPPPFEIPEVEKVKLNKEPRIEHVPIMRPMPNDPMAAILRQQYEAMKERQAMSDQLTKGTPAPPPKNKDATTSNVKK